MILKLTQYNALTMLHCFWEVGIVWTAFEKVAWNSVINSMFSRLWHIRWIIIPIDPPTQTEVQVYSDHLEQYGIIFTILKKNSRNVPCFPEHVISGDASLRWSSNLSRIMLRPFGVVSENWVSFAQILSMFHEIPSKVQCFPNYVISAELHFHRSFISSEGSFGPIGTVWNHFQRL